MDHLTPLKRSELMSKVKKKDTLPEMRVRSALHKMGVRYRLNLKGLPGSPDIVMRSRGRVIFVHGCFWHRHDCRKSALPKTNIDFWRTKFQRNVERDQRNVAELTSMGWAVDVIWQCEAVQPDLLATRLIEIIGR
ncbi:DNA mismatch endonuclease Vsr [Ensifer sp. ENS09]|uniref:very short patch repair endonuclease n=1 Tax=Ensifer sp. ENS09 TaxID=2769263 RepID=UPI001783E149|nr:DNA mismatch endonuclease Vsr [Ensifer sp. ENS09]